ncbi:MULTISPECIES: FAD-dependent 5-carboxymethylaminomethyl-2-thiouridine(34) oxidoreductase MnmC [unclassified Microbulbifer]|uniref:FAD-dependent 5-carboxymethylaminomethyl-2-thiouridine(34) oxidoreductase MnmC n=1 Tax=unclassified Microbulbifer TaxID=2619833 RepID=UPI0027E4CD0C|nr:MULTISPECIES: FAD-dependent 5-carboxymethylaminomethyl-2-thiouridine(34) oxidoreductase MnmC [unclassified Microbulbifer]
MSKDKLHADIEWRDDGQPLSRAFDDIYFSSSSGLEESRYVFLQQNRLPERWAELPEGAGFTIGETGFGTGLNFLAAWQLWLDTAPPDARLHFISVEKYPLHRADLQRALDLWPQLRPLAGQLLRDYPPLLAAGVHRLHFERICLTLVIGEASAALRSLCLEDERRDRLVDAWFLDGFAPAKNPAMWTPELFGNMAALSKPGATFATFTCAGLVKRGLKDAGFGLEKVPGYGRKREMLRGVLEKTGPAEITSTPWHLPDSESDRGQRPLLQPAPPVVGAVRPGAVRPGAVRPGAAPSGAAAGREPSSQPIAVIGAGISGATAARALAERGLKVRVFEQGPEPGSGASGNDQGILYAKLSPKPGPNGDFNLHALLFALRYYRNYCADAAHFCGLLQLAQSDKERELQRQVAEWLDFHQAGDLARAVGAEEAGKIAGLPLDFGGLYFPSAGWLEPQKVCATLLQHKNIELHCNTAVEKLQRQENDWLLRTCRSGPAGSGPWPRSDFPPKQMPIAAREFSADAVIICTANGMTQLVQTSPLPLRPIRGQVSSAAAGPQSQKLETVLCGEGYLAPAFHGRHTYGATFKLKETQSELREAEHQENLANLAELLPQIAGEFSTGPMQGRAAVRAATPDYLPVTGPVPHWESLNNTYAALGKNRKQLIAQTADYQRNLFVLGGLGSRGFTYAPLAAEVLAAWLCGEAMPVSCDLVKALHPARFAIRALGKKNRS